MACYQELQRTLKGYYLEWDAFGYTGEAEANQESLLPMHKKLRDNGLSLVVFALFALSLIGQSVVGMKTYNEERQEQHQPAVSYASYLTTGHFVEAVFENWESEFLQMGVYVFLTAFLFQRGSAESKDPDKEDPPENVTEESPAPVRQGGLVRKLYENSLSLSLLFLFVVSFLLHAAGGRKEYNEQQLAHGAQAVSFLGFLATSDFWFQSLQNWQSEFFSIGAVVVLSIYLRQKGSPESKPATAPHSQTGA